MVQIIRKDDHIITIKSMQSTLMTIPLRELDKLIDKMIAIQSMPNGHTNAAHPKACMVGGDPQSKKRGEIMAQVIPSPKANPVTDTPEIKVGMQLRLLDPFMLGLSYEDYDRGEVVQITRPLDNEKDRWKEGEAWVIEGGCFLLKEEILNPQLCQIVA